MTDHKQNPPERVGELLPYAEVKAMQRGSWVAVADGLNRLGMPPIIYEFPPRAEAVAARAWERSIWQAFLRGDLSPECVLSPSERRQGRVAAWAAVTCCCVLVVLTTLTLAIGLHPLAPFGPSVPLGDRWALVLTYLIFTPYPMMIPALAMNNTYGRDDFVKLSRDDVTVRSNNAGESRLAWKRLVHAREEFFGIVFDFGDLGRVRPRMTSLAYVIFRRVRDPLDAARALTRTCQRLAVLVLVSGAGATFLMVRFAQYFQPPIPLYKPVTFTLVAAAFFWFYPPNHARLRRLAHDRIERPIRLWLRSRRLAKLSKLGTGR